MSTLSWSRRPQSNDRRSVSPFVSTCQFRHTPTVTTPFLPRDAMKARTVYVVVVCVSVCHTPDHASNPIRYSSTSHFRLACSTASVALTSKMLSLNTFLENAGYVSDHYQNLINSSSVHLPFPKIHKNPPRPITFSVILLTDI